MTNKITQSLLIFLTVILGLAVYSFSATLQVTKIGALDLGGKVYNEWWYTGTNPTFYGVAAANSEVTATVNQNSSKVNSDASGKWTFSSSLSAGDYDISFAQGSERTSFKLHLGQNMPENSGAQTQQSTTPDTGRDQMIALTLGAGILLLATYFYITGDPRRKSVFEAKILKED